MSGLRRKLTSRSGRILIQLAALCLVVVGCASLAFVESTAIRLAAAFAISLVALGAIKLAIISLVAATRTESQILPGIERRHNRLARDVQSASQSPDMDGIKQAVGHLELRVGELSEQFDRLSRLIEPSATLIELKDQELEALREQLDFRRSEGSSIESPTRTTKAT